MDFYDILDQVIALLKQRGRASYRALKLQFKLDDASLDVLKDERTPDSLEKKMDIRSAYGESRLRAAYL